MFIDTRNKLSELLAAGYELDTTIIDEDVVYILADTSIMRYGIMNNTDDIAEPLKDLITHTASFWGFLYTHFKEKEPDYSPDSSMDIYESTNIGWTEFGVAGSTSLFDVVDFVWKSYKQDNA